MSYIIKISDLVVGQQSAACLATKVNYTRPVYTRFYTNFKDHVEKLYRDKWTDFTYSEVFEVELSKFNANAKTEWNGNSETVLLEFGSEEDYTYFVLRWS